MKSLKFLVTLYKLTDDGSPRAVFEKDTTYNVRFEDDKIYMLDMPDNSYFKDVPTGIEKGLENTHYLIIKE